MSGDRSRWYRYLSKRQAQGIAFGVAFGACIAGVLGYLGVGAPGVYGLLCGAVGGLAGAVIAVDVADRELGRDA